MRATDTSGGAFAFLEHTLPPGALAEPPHRHAREDEFTYVLEGTLTVWRDGAVERAGPGTIVRKPRGEWHTCWNAGEAPVRVLELVSPPAFAGYVAERAALAEAAGGEPAPEALAVLAARYGVEMDLGALPSLLAAHGLRLG